jgi:beta-phosphoglucomutase
LDGYFDATADGNEITYSKPDPEVFLLAAQKMGIDSNECLVIEDADAGIEAALSANMRVLAIGAASNSIKANLTVESLVNVDVNELLQSML